MQVTPIKTLLVRPGSISILDFVNQSIDKLEDNSVLAVSSKIVSLCENRVIPIESADKQSLISKEADKYIPKKNSKYGHTFAINKNTLVGAAGIDESNGDGNYVLWPTNPQADANNIRKFLCKKFDLKNIGVVITDSISTPLRYGTTGTYISFSGFKAVNSYIGKPDLFDKKITISQANVAAGIAGAANLVMGEGSEQMPLCIVSELDFIEFTGKNPSQKELDDVYVKPEDDLFSVFFDAIEWQKGKN